MFDLEEFLAQFEKVRRPSACTTHGRELADSKDAIMAFLDRLHAESMTLFAALPPEMLCYQFPVATGSC